MEETQIRWSEYMLYRIKERGTSLRRSKRIVRHSAERYTDTDSGRAVIVGRHDERLVLIPIEIDGSTVVPIT